jgi:hypothetical protein
MARTSLASLALVGIVACGRAKQEIAGDDTGGRNLERAPSADAKDRNGEAVAAPVVITLTGPLTVSTQ